jgi:isopentenyl-diphosphate Delta-isomerase
MEEELELVEWLDIVDLEDRVVGTIQRDAAYQQANWHRGVHVLIMNSSGEVLMSLRSSRKKNYPSTFDCSVSEHVKSSEDYIDAAFRGIREELGITDISLEPIIKFKLQKDPHESVISVLYRGIHDGELHQSDDEIQHTHFAPLDKVKDEMEKSPENFSPWTREIIKWYVGQPSAVEVVMNCKKPPIPEPASLDITKAADFVQPEVPELKPIEPLQSQTSILTLQQPQSQIIVIQEPQTVPAHKIEEMPTQQSVQVSNNLESGFTQSTPTRTDLGIDLVLPPNTKMAEEPAKQQIIMMEEVPTQSMKTMEEIPTVTCDKKPEEFTAQTPTSNNQ